MTDDPITIARHRDFGAEMAAAHFVKYPDAAVS
jgi:hypothetical protein